MHWKFSFTFVLLLKFANSALKLKEWSLIKYPVGFVIFFQQIWCSYSNEWFPSKKCRKWVLWPLFGRKLFSAKLVNNVILHNLKAILYIYYVILLYDSMS